MKKIGSIGYNFADNHEKFFTDGRVLFCVDRIKRWKNRLANRFDKNGRIASDKIISQIVPMLWHHSIVEIGESKVGNVKQLKDGTPKSSTFAICEMAKVFKTEDFRAPSPNIYLDRDMVDTLHYILGDFTLHTTDMGRAIAIVDNIDLIGVCMSYDPSYFGSCVPLTKGAE